MSAHPAIDVSRYRFTVEEYERMGTAGIFGEDDRVELIDGEIIQMTPIGPRHAGIVNRLTRLFVLAVGDEAVVTVQNPLRILPRSEPQPDLIIAKPRQDFYTEQHPQPGDVLLAIEVADSRLAMDLAVKAGLYARSGVVEYWVIDVAARAVVVHRQPEPSGYADIQTVAGEERLRPAVATGVDLGMSDIFGP